MDEQLRAMMAEAIKQGLLEGLSMEDMEVASQLANAVMKGEITNDQAFEMMKTYSETIQSDNPADLAEQIKDYVDVTGKVKAALLEAGEPGIADAIRAIKIRPGELKNSEPMQISPPIAFSCKRWFDIDNLSTEERRTLWRAVHLAAKSEGLWGRR